MAVRKDRVVPGSIQNMKANTGATPDVIVLYVQWYFGPAFMLWRVTAATA